MTRQALHQPWLYLPHTCNEEIELTRPLFYNALEKKMHIKM